jgi:hypothetical protein
MRGYDFTYIMRYVNMSLLRLCQEFEDLSNRYVIMIAGGGKPPRVLSGRIRGGYSVGSRDIGKAKLYDRETSAQTDAGNLTDLYDGMIDEHVSNDEIPIFTAMSYGEAKAMLSGNGSPYR